MLLKLVFRRSPMMSEWLLGGRAQQSRVHRQPNAVFNYSGTIVSDKAKIKVSVIRLPYDQKSKYNRPRQAESALRQTF
jgi:hypothetical protein